MNSIAIFDFDGTLARSDSLWPFLLRAAGPWRCAKAAIAAAQTYFSVPKNQDRRTAVKVALLHQALAGLTVEQAKRGAERMRTWPRWIDTTVASLRDHAAKGHHILIATGSLDLYIEEMLADLPHNAVLSTVMETQNGILTGTMLSGNCVRNRKAELVGAYLLHHGPFNDVWVYGNAPHDFPMMELAQHKIVI